MNLSPQNDSEKKKLFRDIFIPLVIGVFMVLAFVLEKGMDWDFRAGGIYPRHVSSLPGIVTMLFVHADLGHLLNNLISFEILGCMLFIFYRQIALKTLILSTFISGIILWIIGREAWHIGASGLIYAIAFFLFFSGILRKHVPLIAISLVVAFLYGSMVWHIFPWQTSDPVSWEGHLGGGISGLILSVAFRKQGPQKPEIDWEDEEMENDDEFSDEKSIDSIINSQKKLMPHFIFFLISQICY